jgi:hypothetical protein
MGVETLLNTDASHGRVLLAARVALRERSDNDDCPRYFAALEEAVHDEQPPFDGVAYAEVYREASVSAAWMAVSLMTNAEREGDGAQRLWSLAACTDNAHVQQLLKEHAVDESRHALLYLALLDLTFPGLTAPAFREELNQLSPRYSLQQELAPVPGSPYAKKPSIDDFLQMNIAEIRTAIHHIMQRPAIASHSAGRDTQKRIGAIQDSLLRDELKHVGYTAVLIERLANEKTPSELSRLFHQRFHDFNQITREELKQGAFDCNVACCAKRPTCRAKIGASS